MLFIGGWLENNVPSTYLDKKSLIARFIDPADMKQACNLFPCSPWKYYLVPQGQYAKSAWRFFRKASAYVAASASRAISSRGREDLSIDQVLELYSLLVTGRKGQAESLVAVPLSVYNDRSYVELSQAFGGGKLYRNPDGLDLRVEGFWPVGQESLDLFLARQLFTKSQAAGDWKGCDKAAAVIRKNLYVKTTKKFPRWHLYWLISPQARLNQLEGILRWYHREVKLVSKSQQQGETSFSKKVCVLAVKMQRYFDAAHVFPDGSGRISRFMGDYVFLRFGFMPPRPVLYTFMGKAYENGTYLPFVKALEMARQGLLRS